MDKFIYVYVYRDPSRNNEPIYVGKGTNERWAKHLTRDDAHPFINRLKHMSANSVLPTIGIIPCESDELALLVEEEAISLYGRKDMGLGPLLNMTDGGDGAEVSAATKLKISIGNKGRKRPDVIARCKGKVLGPNKNPSAPRPEQSLRQLGRKLSEETKRKISETHKRRHMCSKEAQV